MQNHQYTVVIPAHNEANTIREVVQDVLQYISNIIVVDDGSTDNTVKNIRDLPIKIINHPQNLGKSAALATGFKQAITTSCKGVITMDADLQHPATSLPEFIRAADEYPRAIILGARLLEHDARPRKSLIGNLIADFFVDWATNQIILDTQSGFRCYPTSFLQKLTFTKLPKSCFILETYLLVAATKLKYSISNISIPILYPEALRPSHYRPWAHTLPIVFMLTWDIVKHGFKIPGLIKAVHYYYQTHYRKT